mmetsp:Transcript_66/g.129  ORF Transcript_66/g.129 Transcript_66/m.129 type:complete len:279 (-) Transcript_66:14-850(-)|eukprot:CAMPEP_0182927890 /NCGR_PEP_ID=MMETSP0105_2-20130417/14552_1 /TAXON_ID=81532 ORGANISM="Acanthoeca-like sp., Strain 10tr" /NCGR_SAMPLE_ID=MMETSP0105_2 /ASSEMBLY_ACC=CAM_ASM_000205 /LENGTH=278 /DNA_ID=CAMNT_0025065867 /DNA_START=294 /DNA_END=1130 /DNA_ORIENTATION=+
MAAVDKVSWSEARAALKNMRDTQERAPATAARLAEQVLSSPGSLGDEVWAIHEQACIAALDCNRPDVFERSHRALVERFGTESVRVGLLTGKHQEASGKFDEAKATYDALLKIEPTSAALQKRAVAIAAAKGNIPDAIKVMNGYLDKFPADPEAWTEMAALCLKDSRFESAKFCYEELILGNPYNHLFHQRLAEVLYTIGGKANLALCRKHFAQAVNLNPKNTRALYGLLLVAKKLSLSGDKEAAQLAVRAQTLLTELHSGKPAEKMIAAFLSTLGGK